MRYLFFLLCLCALSCSKKSISPAAPHAHEVSFIMEDKTNGDLREKTYSSTHTEAWFRTEPSNVLNLPDEDSLTMVLRINLMQNTNSSVGFENFILSLRTQIRKGDLIETNRPDPYLKYEDPASYLEDLLSTENIPEMKLEYYQNYFYGVSSSFPESAAFRLEKAVLQYDEAGKPYFDLEGSFASDLSFAFENLAQYTVSEGKFLVRVYPDFY